MNEFLMAFNKNKNDIKAKRHIAMQLENSLIH
jgi:hypothetical protein